MTASQTTSAHGREQELAELRAAVRDGRTVLLTGSFGIGKSHLLRELTIDPPHDWRIWRATGNEAAATIPFGAVASWLPDIDTTRQATLLESAVNDVIRRSGDRVPVLVVDDVHHLDRGSVRLLHELAITANAPLIAATRTEDLLPGAVVALLDDLDGERTQLGPLPDTALRALAASQFVTGLEQRVVDELVDRSRGNPLLLLESARARASRTAQGAAGGLMDLVHTRLNSLSDPTRTLLECVAIAEPLPMHVLVTTEVFDDEAVAELERAELLTVTEEPSHRDNTDGHERHHDDGDESRLVVRCAHPVYAEIVRTGLTPGARHLAAALVGRAVLAAGERRHGDALHLGRSLLDLDQRPEADLAVVAAREALTSRDTHLAQRLVEIALDAEPHRPDALALAGSICDIAGDPADAETLLRRSLVHARTDADIAATVMSLLWHGNHAPRGDAVWAELRTAAARTTTPALRRWMELLGDAAPSYDGALAVLADLCGGPEPDERVEWANLVLATAVEAHICWLPHADEHLARATPMTATQASTDPIGSDVLCAAELQIAFQRGQLDIAAERAHTRLDDARRSGRPHGITACTAGAIVHWTRGDIAVARATLVEAIDELEQFDPLNAASLAHSQAAMLAAIDDDGYLAEHHRRISDQSSDTRSPHMETWFLRAEGWLAAQRDPDAAVELFAAATRVAIGANQFQWALLTIQDAVMLDAATAVSRELANVADKPVQAPFMELLVDHARAHAGGDLGAISRCAGRFEQVGAAWYAANAWQAVARLAPDGAERSRAATRAVIVGPAAALGPHATETQRWALSPRRTEIAMRAARGATSKIIADDLNVSVRTVEDSLHRTYKAFGISGRDELGSVLPGQTLRHNSELSTDEPGASP